MRGEEGEMEIVEWKISITGKTKWKRYKDNK